VSEQRSGRRPEQLFFTDDRADNVAAARARGWTAHQFTTTELLAGELGAWLGLPLSVHPPGLAHRPNPAASTKPAEPTGPAEPTRGVKPAV
jgi:hypothetical protein